MPINKPDPTLFGMDVYTESDWLAYLKSEPRPISELPTPALELFGAISKWSITRSIFEHSPFLVFTPGLVQLTPDFKWPKQKTCPTCGGPLRC